MNYLICYEIGTGVGWISGDCVIREGKKLTERYVDELRSLVRETAIERMSSEVPAGTQFKNLIFRSIVTLGG